MVQITVILILLNKSREENTLTYILWKVRYCLRDKLATLTSTRSSVGGEPPGEAVRHPIRPHGRHTLTHWPQLMTAATVQLESDREKRLKPNSHERCRSLNNN